MIKEVEHRTIQNGHKPIDHLLGSPLPIEEPVIAQIALNGRNILDFGKYMGPAHRHQLEETWRKKQSDIPEERRQIIKDVVRPAIERTPTLFTPLSVARINPETMWEGDYQGNKPDLFFGMGGGSTSIIKAASFESLTMFLNAEEIMRKVSNDGKRRAILANRITYTNLPYSPDFLPKGVSMDNVQQLLKEKGPSGIEEAKEIQVKIDKRLQAERDILTIACERMGFDMGKWDIFLQTDIDKVVDEQALQRYEKTIAKHNEILHRLTGLDEYHYAQEDGIIDALVNGPQGGIKLGWWIRNLDEVNGGYIMDEQPFHARWITGQALREDTSGDNKVTLIYAYGAPRLYPDAHGNMRKASPYICYDPEDMVTLHPDDDIVGKFRSATEAGGGFNFKFVTSYYDGLVNQFERLANVKLDREVVDGKEIAISDIDQQFKGERLAHKVRAMRDYLVHGNEDKIRQLWGAFEEDSPKQSEGIPMKLPVSEYFQFLGIQPKDLYYRVKGQTYDEDVFGPLNEQYQYDKNRMNFTRDILNICASVHEKVWDTAEGKLDSLKLYNPKVRKIYEAVAQIGQNTGIELFKRDGKFAMHDSFQPDEALFEESSESSLHINSNVTQHIASLDLNEQSSQADRLEHFMTIASYPNTQRVRKKLMENGYSLRKTENSSLAGNDNMQANQISDEELKILQSIAEDFFESRLKGSTPRKKWRELYSS